MSPEKITAKPDKHVATVATFVTTMRAQSLIEYLELQSIRAVLYYPPHINKQMPPPRIAVIVAKEDAEEAQAAYERWKAY